MAEDEVKLLPCPRCSGTGTVHGMAEDEGGACTASWPCEHCTRPPIGTDEVVERVARALQEADLHDGDEGNRYRLFDLLGFSGQNKCVMITRQLANAAIAAMKDAASD